MTQRQPGDRVLSGGRAEEEVEALAEERAAAERDMILDLMREDKGVIIKERGGTYGV